LCSPGAYYIRMMIPQNIEMVGIGFFHLPSFAFRHATTSFSRAFPSADAGGVGWKHLLGGP